MPGDVVLAKWEEDGVFYPAEVVRVTSDSVRVLFCDYGNYATVHMRDIQEIDEEKAADIDIDNAVTATVLDDFDPVSGARLNGSAATGGASMGGGGSKNVRGARRIGGIIQFEDDNTTQDGAPSVTLLFRLGCVFITGKGSELFSISARVPSSASRNLFARIFESSSTSVSRLGKVRAPGGAVAATASRRGGQSALRFSRIAEAQRREYVKSVARSMNEKFVAKNLDAIVVIGGNDLKHLLIEAARTRVPLVLRRLMTVCPGEIDATANSRGVRIKTKGTKQVIKTMTSDHALRTQIAACIRNASYTSLASLLKRKLDAKI